MISLQGFKQKYKDLILIRTNKKFKFGLEFKMLGMTKAYTSLDFALGSVYFRKVSSGIVYLNGKAYTGLHIKKDLEALKKYLEFQERLHVVL